MIFLALVKITIIVTFNVSLLHNIFYLYYVIKYIHDLYIHAPHGWPAGLNVRYDVIGYLHRYLHIYTADV